VPEVGGWVEASIFAPEVTDQSIAQSRPVASIRTTTDDVLTFRAPRAGRWTLRVRTQNRARYEVFAGLVEYTRTLLSGYRRTGVSRFAILGRVTGARSGRVVAQVRIGSAWLNRSSVTLRRGRFSYRLHLPRNRRLVTRAVYIGDRSHQGSASNGMVVRGG
jgi:hypothetical protein